jgi:hypothetical protein
MQSFAFLHKCARICAAMGWLVALPPSAARET